MLDIRTIENVKEYYGKTLKTNDDLKTSACCIDDSTPKYLKNIIAELHDEVVSKFYGCGAPLPHSLEGCTVLDLGSGSGRDAYVLSKLVGPSGRVIGVDMTNEQIEVAKKHQEFHKNKFGYQTSNVEFHQGYIEDLKSIGIQDNSVDLVVSNCVINLSPAKDKVFSELFRVLKPGGELYFSDVFSGQRIPTGLAQDPVIHGECLGGAMYIEDFRRLIFQTGCSDYRVIQSRPLSVDDPDIFQKIGMIDFYSMTIRAFKLDLEDRCEDYGQVAYYLGTIPGCPHDYTLDDHHVLKTNQPLHVCSNTAKMLTDTRLKPHFKVEGDTSQHFGLFDCSSDNASTPGNETAVGCC